VWIFFKNYNNLQKEKPGDVMEETTSDRPDNSFTPAFAKVLHPKGIRIDYLMYRSNSGITT